MPKTSAKRFSNAQQMAQNCKRLTVLAFVAALLIALLGRFDVPFNAPAAFAQRSDESEYRRISQDDCGYLRDPEGIRGAMSRHRDEVSRTTDFLASALTLTESSELSLVPPQDIPRKNFIDNLIFDRMAKDNIQSAPLASDAEFIRRAYLDLTGRIPAAEDVTRFLSDTNANKRDALVDALLGSPEYVDKWTMFFGDLYKNNARATNIQRYSGARDAFYNYIKSSIAANKSYAQMVREMIAANGDNFVVGETNFIVGGVVPMGPPQDTMDGRAVNAATMFLGINAVDCLLCHDGAGHLDAVNLWGKDRTRAQAWGLSAFFARVRQQNTVLSQQPNYIKRTISELPNGEYQLNTTSGNRSARQPVNGQNTAQPNYFFTGGTVNTGENRRQALARLLTADKQFARATVNYIWEKLMVEALVSPSNTFDLARLDAAANNYDLRKLIATIVKSNTYQLSSQYPGAWNLSLVPYYARKLVRRLDAEEIHDAIIKATGVGVTYQLRDTLNQPTWTVNWAMQLPDTNEPRGNAIGGFLNSFIRGDRDVKPRSLEPAIMQALNLMNNNFVMQRIHQNNAGSLVARLLADANLTPTQITTQLYLSTLARNPTADELGKLTPLFTSMTRRDATEAIQWALLNKIDFMFNY
jgi:hypothetical protein